jgi:hypothetical protein
LACLRGFRGAGRFNLDCGLLRMPSALTGSLPASHPRQPGLGWPTFVGIARPGLVRGSGDPSAPGLAAAYR